MIGITRSTRSRVVGVSPQGRTELAQEQIEREENNVIPGELTVRGRALAGSQATVLTDVRHCLAIRCLGGT